MRGGGPCSEGVCLQRGWSARREGERNNHTHTHTPGRRGLWDFKTFGLRSQTWPNRILTVRLNSGTVGVGSGRLRFEKHVKTYMTLLYALSVAQHVRRQCYTCTILISYHIYNGQQNSRNIPYPTQCDSCINLYSIRRLSALLSCRKQPAREASAPVGKDVAFVTCMAGGRSRRLLRRLRDISERTETVQRRNRNRRRA